jgi:hypothetical protein
MIKLPYRYFRFGHFSFGFLLVGGVPLLVNVERTVDVIFTSEYGGRKDEIKLNAKRED